MTWRQKHQKHIAQAQSAECVPADEFGLIMDGYTQSSVDAIVKAFDISRHKFAVDIGGKKNDC